MRQAAPIPLDALPDGRCSEALALFWFLRRVDMKYFCGGHSTTVLNDLERAGLVRVDRFDHFGIRINEVVSVKGVR